MTKRTGYITVFTFFLGFTMICMGESSLINPSFEKPSAESTNIPEGWVNDPASIMTAWISGDAHEGTRSIRIDGSGKNGNYWRITKRIPSLPNQIFTFEGWIKLDNGWGDNELKISWFDASGKWLSISRSAPVNGTSDWKKVSVSAAVPANATEAILSVGRRYETGKGVSWFDDLSLSISEKK